MDIKTRLQQYEYIIKNITNLENRLLEIDTKLQKVTNTLSADRVQVTKDNDKWTDLIDTKIKIQNEINKQLVKAYKEMEWIENTIEELNDREKLLMRLRYIDGLKWEEICLMIDRRWRQVHNIHSDALKNILNKL